MRSGPGRVPFAAVLVVLALGLMPSLASAQGTGCAFTRSAAAAAPEPNVRSALRCLVNVERARHGLRALHASSRLTAAADRHSADMVVRGYFAHVTPEGASVADRVRQTGYLGGSRDWSLGEDIGWGTYDLGTPTAIVAAWMKSPPHRAIILSGRFREIGVGVAIGTPDDRSEIGAVYTLDVGRR